MLDCRFLVGASSTWPFFYLSCHEFLSNQNKSNYIYKLYNKKWSYKVVRHKQRSSTSLILINKNCTGNIYIALSKYVNCFSAEEESPQKERERERKHHWIYACLVIQRSWSTVTSRNVPRDPLPRTICSRGVHTLSRESTWMCGGRRSPLKHRRPHIHVKSIHWVHTLSRVIIFPFQGKS